MPAGLTISSGAKSPELVIGGSSGTTGEKSRVTRVALGAVDRSAEEWRDPWMALAHDRGVRVRVRCEATSWLRTTRQKNSKMGPGLRRDDGQIKSPRSMCCGGFVEAPGDDLLLHGLSHTTIGAGAFHFRVRDGNGWDHTANVARELVRVALIS